MSSPRIVVFAYSDLGHACLKFLMEHGDNVVAVYTHEDNPNEKIWFPSVKALARSKNIPVHLDVDLKLPGKLKILQNIHPDLIFSFYYRNMIPSAVLTIPPLGAYNMHGSYLPKFRGRAPVNWAVLQGEKYTGASLHVMVEKPDAGDIVDQEAVPIGPDDTTAIVQARVTEAAVKVLSRQINNLKSGEAPRHPQDASQATYFGRRTAEDGRIDWNWPAQKVHNLVRAVSKPYPGAFADQKGNERLLIWKTSLTGKQVTSGPIGQLRQEAHRQLVTCGDRFEVEILEMEKQKTT